MVEAGGPLRLLGAGEEVDPFSYADPYVDGGLELKILPGGGWATDESRIGNTVVSRKYDTIARPFHSEFQLNKMAHAKLISMGY